LQLKGKNHKNSTKTKTDSRTSFSSTPGTNYFLTKATRVRFTANLYILSPEETFLLTEDGKIKRQFLRDNIFFRPNKSIWTGSTPDGRRNPSKYCDGWRSANSNNVGLSSNLRYLQIANLNLKSDSSAGLLNQQVSKCSERKVILCVENAASDSGH